MPWEVDATVRAVAERVAREGVPIMRPGALIADRRRETFEKAAKKAGIPLIAFLGKDGQVLVDAIEAATGRRYPADKTKERAIELLAQLRN